nr:unnamed protein product [Digitaria exilis]
MTATHPLCVNALPLPEATTQLPPLSSTPVTTGQPRLASPPTLSNPPAPLPLPLPAPPHTASAPARRRQDGTDPSAETSDPRGLGGTARPPTRASRLVSTRKPLTERQSSTSKRRGGHLLLSHLHAMPASSTFSPPSLTPVRQ